MIAGGKWLPVAACWLCTCMSDPDALPRGTLPAAAGVPLPLVGPTSLLTVPSDRALQPQPSSPCGPLHNVTVLKAAVSLTAGPPPGITAGGRGQWQAGGEAPVPGPQQLQPSRAKSPQGGAPAPAPSGDLDFHKNLRSGAALC